MDSHECTETTALHRWGCQPSSHNTQCRDTNICRDSGEDILNKAKSILELLFVPRGYIKMIKISPSTDVQLSREKDPNFGVDPGADAFMSNSEDSLERQ